MTHLPRSRHYQAIFMLLLTTLFLGLSLLVGGALIAMASVLIQLRPPRTVPLAPPLS